MSLPAVASDDPLASRLSHLSSVFRRRHEFLDRPRKSLFIPFFGAMFGGVSERNFGHHGMFEATAGLHVLFTKNVIATLEGGYVFPFGALDELSGPRALLTTNFTMW